MFCWEAKEIWRGAKSYLWQGNVVSYTVQIEFGGNWTIPATTQHVYKKQKWRTAILNTVQHIYEQHCVVCLLILKYIYPQIVHN